MCNISITSRDSRILSNVESIKFQVMSLLNFLDWLMDLATTSCDRLKTKTNEKNEKLKWSKRKLNGRKIGRSKRKLNGRKWMNWNESGKTEKFLLKEESLVKNFLRFQQETNKKKKKKKINEKSDFVFSDFSPKKAMQRTYNVNCKV